MRILVCMCILSGGLAAQDSAKTSPPPAAPPAKLAKQTKKADHLDRHTERRRGNYTRVLPLDR
jgi:hypothetical protein